MHKVRCFGDGKPFYARYHDEEWGEPLHDDQALFEMLSLEGAQAGLSWETVLKKRAGYRTLFHQFDIRRVSQMGDDELEDLVQNPSIIRNRLKIFSVRKNARVVLQIQKEEVSFDRYLWSYVNGKPQQSSWERFEDVPTRSEMSDALSKDLKKRGMSFVGSTIMYAFMQAVGMVNDHLLACWRHPHNRNSSL